MRMMLVGAGAVGESILRILQSRENHKEWLDFVLVADYDLDRAKEVVNNLENISKEKDKLNKDNERYYIPIKVDARNKDEMIKLIKDYKYRFRNGWSSTICQVIKYLMQLMKVVRIMEVWELGQYLWIILSLV